MSMISACALIWMLITWKSLFFAEPRTHISKFHLKLTAPAVVSPTDHWTCVSSALPRHLPRNKLSWLMTCPHPWLSFTRRTLFFSLHAKDATSSGRMPSVQQSWWAWMWRNVCICAGPGTVSCVWAHSHCWSWHRNWKLLHLRAQLCAQFCSSNCATCHNRDPTTLGQRLDRAQQFLLARMHRTHLSLWMRKSSQMMLQAPVLVEQELRRQTWGPQSSCPWSFLTWLRQVRRLLFESAAALARTLSEAWPNYLWSNIQLSSCRLHDGRE